MLESLSTLEMMFLQTFEKFLFRIWKSSTMALVLCCLTVSAVISAVSSAPAKPNARIVGGVPVSANHYPWMVALRSIVHYNGFGNDFGPTCGASLIDIDPPTIVTAAHCVDESVFQTDDDDQSYEYWGEYGWLPVTHIADINRTDADEFIDGDSFQRLNWTASMMTIHPKWNTSEIAYGYDIALIVVDDGQKLNFSEDDLPRIPMTPLPGNMACCDDGEHLEAIGYGNNHSNGTATDTLEHTSLHFVEVEECGEILLGSYYASLYEMDNKMVCAIGDRTDTCQGMDRQII